MCAGNPQAFQQAYSPNNSGMGNLMAGWITAAHQKRTGMGGGSSVGGTVASPVAARYMAMRPAFSQSAGPQLDNRLGA
jgi:hypothetical protein